MLLCQICNNSKMRWFLLFEMNLLGEYRREGGKERESEEAHPYCGLFFLLSACGFSLKQSSRPTLSSKTCLYICGQLCFLSV